MEFENKKCDAYKYYMPKPESVQENSTELDHPILTRRPDLILVNKKKRTGF